MLLAREQACINVFLSHKVDLCTFNRAPMQCCNYLLCMYVNITAPSEGVQNVTSTVLSSTEIEIQWLPPNLDSWNGILTNYTIGMWVGV